MRQGRHRDCKPLLMRTTGNNNVQKLSIHQLIQCNTSGILQNSGQRMIRDKKTGLNHTENNQIQVANNIGLRNFK